MRSDQRRKAIFDMLLQAESPISASALAEKFSVSRQVVVGDVALLRSGGAEIIATPRGYVTAAAPAGFVRQLAVRHTAEQMEAELDAVVDNGCTMLDVIVEHPVYGQITGPLRISNRYEVGQFIQRCAGSEPLSKLTDGIHLHTISCPDEEAFLRVQRALHDLGVLLEES